MEKKSALIFICFAAACTLIFAPPARAENPKDLLQDFRICGKPDKDLYPSSLPILDLAVTPDDRFVVLLRENSLAFLDTWNFEMVEKAGEDFSITVASGTTVYAKSLGLSPDGRHVFVGRSDGKIAVVTLLPLYSLMPGQELASNLSVNLPPTTTLAGSSIVPIIALPDYRNTTPTWLIFGVKKPLSRELYFASFQGGVLSFSSSSYLIQETPELAAGNSAGFALYKDNLANYYLQTHACQASIWQGCRVMDFLPLPAGTFAGLAADKVADEYAATVNNTTKELLVIDTLPLSDIKEGPSIYSPAAADLDILPAAATPFGPDSDIIINAAQSGSKLMLALLNAANLSFGDTVYVSGSFSRVEASSGRDGFIYAVQGTSLYAVSANPWFTASTLSPGDTITDVFTITAVFETPGNTLDCTLYRDQTFGDWKISIAADLNNQVGTGDTVSCVLGGTVGQLPQECENVLTVIAEDEEGRKGRGVVTVYRDTPPPPQSFSLGFGDRRVIYSFTALPLCDLAAIEVWYGTTTKGITDYSSLSTLAIKATTYSSSVAGKKIEDSIENLINGVRYYVWVAVRDKGGKVNIGRPQMEIPQEVLTLTDLTDEKGGINCFSSIALGREGGAKGMVLLLLPLVAGGGVRLWQSYRGAGRKR